MSTASKKTTPIDELRSKIGAEQNSLDRVEARLVELEEELRAALLADDDSPLADVETTIVATKRQQARHGARLEIFLAELEVLEEVDRQTEARLAYEAAAEQIRQAERWLLVDYSKHARALAEGLAVVQAADRLAERVNAELPAGCARLRPPSSARHVAQQDDRRETRKRLVWVGQDGRELGAVQIVGGKPTAAGARLVEREEIVDIPGRRGWVPLPVYDEAKLPRLNRDDEDFWLP